MGHVEQLGDPKEIYTKPNNMFVANFIGTSNFLDGTAKDGVVKILGRKEIPMNIDNDFNGAVKIAVRPEFATLAAEDQGEIKGTITLATFLGDFICYEIQIDNGPVVEINEYTNKLDQLRDSGDRVSIQLIENRINVFDAKTEKSIML